VLTYPPVTKKAEDPKRAHWAGTKLSTEPAQWQQNASTKWKQNVATQYRENIPENKEIEKSDRENQETWDKAIEQVKKDLPVGEAAARLSGTTLVEVTDTRALIFVPKRNALPWLERRLYGQIAKAMKGVVGKDLDLQFVSCSWEPEHPFLLCWHVKSVAGSTDSLKPQALRVPSYRRAGLEGIRSASLRGTCASKPKKQRGSSGEAIPRSPMYPGREKWEEGLSPKPDNCLFYNWGESSQGRVHSGASAEEWIGAKRRSLISEERQPLSLKKKRLEKDMQQSHLTTYADVGEVRTVTGAATCNQLLATGWVLLGVCPLNQSQNSWR
jgi:hypothetical protein